MRRQAESTLDRFRPLLQMRLGAIPFLAQAQGSILWQVKATVGATNHLDRALFAGPLLFGDRTFEFAPKPYRGSNNGDPEQ